MELKEGMYVRTKEGLIHQILDTEIKIKFRFDTGINTPFYENGEYKNQIIKASHNIIDLIEDDDIAVIEYYVSKYRKRINRMFECSLFKSKEDDFVIFENKHCNWWYDKNKKEWVRAKGFNPKIKSIVTKEQFSSMEYKVC